MPKRLIWTHDMLATLSEMRAAGRPLWQIAERVGVAYDTANMKCRELGFPREGISVSHRDLERLLGESKPKRKPTTYRVVDSRGQVHTRQTWIRTYTHCVVVHIGKAPAHGPYSLTEWAGAAELAAKVVRRWNRIAKERDLRISGAIEGVELLETEVERR